MDQCRHEPPQAWANAGMGHHRHGAPQAWVPQTWGTTGMSHYRHGAPQTWATTDMGFDFLFISVFFFNRINVTVL